MYVMCTKHCRALFWLYDACCLLYSADFKHLSDQIMHRVNACIYNADSRFAWALKCQFQMSLCPGAECRRHLAIFWHITTSGSFSLVHALSLTVSWACNPRNSLDRTIVCPHESQTFPACLTRWSSKSSWLCRSITVLPSDFYYCRLIIDLISLLK